MSPPISVLPSMALVAFVIQFLRGGMQLTRVYVVYTGIYTFWLTGMTCAAIQ